MRAGTGDSMRITCPNCETRYDVPEAKIGTKGRQVRCARCGTRWHATASAEPDDTEVAAGSPTASFRVDEPDPRGPADDTVEAGETSWLDAGPEADAPADPGRAPERDTGADDPEPDPWAAALDESSAPIAARGAAAEATADTRAEMTSQGTAQDDGPEPPSEDTKPKPADVETVAKRPAIRIKKKPPARKLTLPKLPKLEYRAVYTRAKPYIGLLLFVLALALPVAAIVFRTSVVAAMPSMAGLYDAIGLPVNLRGLVFEGVDTIRELEGGQPVLVVEGAIHNPTERTRPLPSIRLSLRSDDQQEIYAWSVDPKATSVAPGASVRFRTKLAAPPDQARDVQIRFTERRSRQAAHP